MKLSYLYVHAKRAVLFNHEVVCKMYSRTPQLRWATVQRYVSTRPIRWRV
jgi:hypothetical protein